MAEQIERRPKIVSIAGGTGRYQPIRGLKNYAVVTAGYNNIDSWGSSGRLRVGNGCLPYGDGTQACAALADETEDEMFLLDRFENGDGIKDHKIANLMCEVAVRKFGVVKGMRFIVSKYCVPGSSVLPVSPEIGIHLAAATAKGTIYFGEHEIDVSKKDSRIVDAWLTKKNGEELKVKPEEIPLIKSETSVYSQALPEMLEAINEADAVLLGPGSLYTSILANLLVDDIAGVIRRSKAIKIFMCNFANDTTETEGFSAEDYAELISTTLGCKIDHFIVNKGFLIEDETVDREVRVVDESELDPDLLDAYKKEGKEFVSIKDRAKLDRYVEHVHEIPLVAVVRSGARKLLRHHSEISANAIISIIEGRSFTLPNTLAAVS